MASITLSSYEFEDRITDSLRRSLTQPVVITHQGKPSNVLISFEEYERLVARDRQAYRTRDLTDRDLAEIEAARMEPGLEYLDAELSAR